MADTLASQQATEVNQPTPPAEVDHDIVGNGPDRGAADTVDVDLGKATGIAVSSPGSAVSSPGSVGAGRNGQPSEDLLVRKIAQLLRTKGAEKD